MTVITDVFSKNLILFHPPDIDNKKNCFELICTMITQRNPGLKQKVLFDALYNRELIGNTIIAPDVAIPHARIANLTSPIGVITKLTKSIPFSANNEQSVALLFSLFVSENAEQEHLNVLAQLATKLKDEAWIKQLLQAHNPDQLWNTFSES